MFSRFLIARPTFAHLLCCCPSTLQKSEEGENSNTKMKNENAAFSLGFSGWFFQVFPLGILTFAPLSSDTPSGNHESHPPFRAPPGRDAVHRREDWRGPLVARERPADPREERADALRVELRRHENLSAISCTGSFRPSSTQ